MDSSSKQPTAAAKKSTLTPVLTLEGHQRSIPSVSYFPDGKRMISGSRDKTARQWDIEMGKEIKEARDVYEREVRAVGVSRDGRCIVTAGGDFNIGELKACEVETGTVMIFEGHSRRITCIDISADSTLLVSGSLDGTVRIWSLETGKLVTVIFNDAENVGAVRFSQDSKKLAVKSWRPGNRLAIWDIRSPTLDVQLTKLGGGMGLTSAPVFWTMKDRTIIATFSFTDDPDYPNTIYEFDTSTLNIVGAPFQGHTLTVTSLALSHDCVLLVSASSIDNTIKLWDFESRQLLASFDILSTIYHLILSPDSRQLVYTTMRNIYVCNIPPEILANIQPVPQIRTSAPRNIPLIDYSSLTFSFAANQSASGAPSNAQHSPPSHSIPPPPSLRPIRRLPGSGFWTGRHAGTSRIQPTDIRPLTNKQQWPTLIPPSQIPSSTVGSRLPHFLTHPYEFPSSFSTDPFLPVRSIESNDSHPEAMLHDLTGCINKDEDYPVARGGFGEIWKCTFHNDRRSVKVAVKALQVYAADQLGVAKAKKIKRIKHELRICAKLKHANILPVYGYTHGFGPFLAIVSPWAENGNLSDYLEVEGAALTLVRRFEILKDIIAGLQYLHANSVIHGDFNGPNVLIHGDGTACVADFGLSLMYSEVISPSQASWTSTLKGNMRWMAPELLVLEREDGPPTRPSEQSDIFSFGGIILQVLTNKIPYYYLPNDAAIVLCIAKSEKPFRSRYPELPEKYWPFIEQCWSTDPRDRPSAEGADVTIRNEFYALSRSR